MPKILPSKKGVTKTNSKSPPAKLKQCAKKKPLVTKKTRSQPKCANFSEDQFRPVGRKKAAKIQLVHETNQVTGTHNLYEGLEVQSISDQGKEYEYNGNYKWHPRNKPKAKKKEGKLQDRKINPESYRSNAVSQIQPVKSGIHDKPKALRKHHENIHMKCESEISEGKSHVTGLDFSHRPASQSCVKKQPQSIQSVQEFCGTGVRMRGSSEINSCDQKKDHDPETQFLDHTFRTTNHIPRQVQTCDTISESVSQIPKSEIHKFLSKHGKMFCNLSGTYQPNVIKNDILNKKAQQKLSVLKQKVKVKIKLYFVKILPNSKLKLGDLAKV